MHSAHFAIQCPRWATVQKSERWLANNDTKKEPPHRRTFWDGCYSELTTTTPLWQEISYWYVCLLYLCS